MCSLRRVLRVEDYTYTGLGALEAQAKAVRRDKKKWINVARAIKFFGVPHDLPWKLVTLMFIVCNNKLEAELELRRRYLQGRMTPELAYDLIMIAYEDPQKAIEAQSAVLLASMPEPSNDNNYN